MERSIKRYLILFFIILYGSTMGVAIGLFLLGEEEKKVRVNLERRLEATVKTKEMVARRLDEKEGRVGVLAEELAEEKQRAEVLAEELAQVAQEKEKSEIIVAQLKEKDSIISDLLFKLKGDKKEILDLKKELEDLQERLNLVVASKEELEKKLTSALSKPTRGEVPPEKIVVEATPLFKGRVIVVNREFGFVVLDLGKEDKLEVGAILSIYRQNELIARVQVEKVSSQVSTATILPRWKDVEIRKDDIVRKP